MSVANAAVATTKAVFCTQKGGPEIRDLGQAAAQAPDLGEDEVLIRNVAVASNPKDWKVARWGMFEGIEGNDVAGTIEAVGSKVTRFSEGDRVAAFTRVATHDKYGAYQARSVAPACTTWHIHANTTYEQAAALNLAFLTAAVGLYVTLGLPEPQDNSQPISGAEKQGVIVWGAGSTLGDYAVQLAKKSGLRVIAVAGNSASYVQSLGADAVVDYRSKDAVDQIVKAARSLDGVSWKCVLDAVSENGSVESSVEVMDQLGGGRVITTLASHMEEKRKDTVERYSVGSAYGANGHKSERWNQLVAEWVERGTFKVHPIKVMPNGLASVPEGIKLLEEGKVSGHKLVCELVSTRMSIASPS
ncbi:GroES-like protein [Ceraceosorus guamensis]|uniref:GroES-like protein n=1 Tax=Ceraceosorus guamensis TaxID=1522189 RepID=A0A316W5E5_9BASI|nr:GroES-like protein [Ceraceosorus guamensis]PWN45176.1 GroES-like protein [Ceraceosorus guamensis]